jgi:hypothetical protein
MRMSYTVRRMESPKALPSFAARMRVMPIHQTPPRHLIMRGVCFSAGVRILESSSTDYACG